MRKLISVIVPAYNEQDCVDELARRLTNVFSLHQQYDFEVLIVENGSLDDTWERLAKIHQQDARFKVIRLARNFRMDGGLTAGLHFARGDAAVLPRASPNGATNNTSPLPSERGESRCNSA
jgi:dolichol-phosphate mannosyltransferase